MPKSRCRFVVPALAIAAVLAAGCRGERAPAAGQPGAPAAAPSARPDTLRTTIVLEGNPQPITLVLYRTPAGFPLPFTTYVPLDMAAQTTPDGVGFVANFAGRRNDSVAVRLLPQPVGTGEAGARKAAQALAAAHGDSAVGPIVRRFRWSIAEYPIGGKGTLGVVAVGRHAGREFLLLAEHPPAYGPGFGPRAVLILQELRWNDGGGIATASAGR